MVDITIDSSGFAWSDPMGQAWTVTGDSPWTILSLVEYSEQLPTQADLRVEDLGCTMSGRAGIPKQVVVSLAMDSPRGLSPWASGEVAITTDAKGCELGHAYVCEIGGTMHFDAIHPDSELQLTSGWALLQSDSCYIDRKPMTDRGDDPNRGRSFLPNASLSLYLDGRFPHGT
jgi:hypothetical protein